jgi:signal-transduction protein with cAMP-binding, CBS, and nucleotidyltransferase domain
MSPKLKEIMVEDVVTVKATSTIKEAAELMNKNEIGCLIVIDKGKPAGIITERDMLKRVINESRRPKQTTVSQVMSKPLISVQPKMQAGDAAKMMLKQKIKKLPVIENDQILGLVTLTDLIQSEEVLDFLNGRSYKNAPKRIKKIVDLYYDRAKRYRRRCPLIMKDGFSMGCQEKRCMWWLGDECAVTKLSSNLLEPIEA